MIGSRGRRLALVATSLAASLATGGVAAAAAPTVETSSVHIERPFVREILRDRRAKRDAHVEYVSRRRHEHGSCIHAASLRWLTDGFRLGR